MARPAQDGVSVRRPPPRCRGVGNSEWPEMDVDVRRLMRPLESESNPNGDGAAWSRTTQTQRIHTTVTVDGKMRILACHAHLDALSMLVSHAGCSWSHDIRTLLSLESDHGDRTVSGLAGGEACVFREKSARESVSERREEGLGAWLDAYADPEHSSRSAVASIAPDPLLVAASEPVLRLRSVNVRMLVTLKQGRVVTDILEQDRIRWGEDRLLDPDSLAC
ncbi:hypothetical protein LXA43DRAFT_544191 [Ganoderma leucocontextum]|nr:hypothetical protein LXA43DRAFT_544191 [Ganoderma leucocontextum]